MVRRERTILPFQQKGGETQEVHFICPGHVCAGDYPLLPYKRDSSKLNGTTRYGSQVTDSEEHPGWRRRSKAPSLEDVGGDFFTQKSYVVGHPTNVSLVSSIQSVSFCDCWQIFFAGPVWAIKAADVVRFPFPSMINSSVSQLDALGATAISRCKPTNSVASLATALGELVKDGLPSLALDTWKHKADTGRNIGNDYLNTEFGWKPLVHDIKSFAGGVTHARKLLAQYERDAGKVVRRHYTFPTITEVAVPIDLNTNTQVYYEPFNTLFMNSGLTSTQKGLLVQERTTVQRRWFSGAFTYYLPTGYDSRNEVDRIALLAKQILGLDINPSLLWELAPWSWAVDWFSNAGDVISNVSDFQNDSLIMRYGYMMEHTINKVTYTRKHKNVFKDASQLVDSSVSLITETKMRRRANPYGFGLTWDNLSLRQLSILSALGITRRK